MTEPTLLEAAKAAWDHWDSQQWEWTKIGSTADLMNSLRDAIAREEAKAVTVRYEVRVKTMFGSSLCDTEDTQEAAQLRKHVAQQSRTRPVFLIKITEEVIE